MGNAFEVSDSLSNTEEQIERAAKTIGKGERRRVFDAIYHHKAMVKTVDEISQKTGLSRMRVLQEGRHMVRKQLVRQTRKNQDTAYEKIDFFHAHKRQILRLAASPKLLAKLPTKRKAGTLPKFVTIPSAGANVIRITIDELQSFAKVKAIGSPGRSLPPISEDQFKRGIQAVVGEPGVFKDWGGEKSDLYSTRIRITGKRLAAAFAFKGPGERQKLTPGRMGKNGDQAQRLFQEDADVFLVQHWREIESSVSELLRSLAVAKSVTTGRRIWYGVIDGKDSDRLRTAYPGHFNHKPPAKRKRTKGKRKPDGGR